MADYALSREVARLERDAEQRGIRLVVSDDFDALAWLNRSLDRPALTPMFHPHFSGIGTGDAFWAKGVAPTGEVVHLQAVRFDRLAGDLAANLSDWLLPLYWEAGDTPVPAEGGLSRAPVCRSIRGSVAYHGELWIKAGAGRGLVGLMGTLTRWGVMKAFLTWHDLDWIYGFVTKRKVMQGMPQRGGYTITEPCGLCWRQPPRDEDQVEWIAAAPLSAIRCIIEEQLLETSDVVQRTEVPALEPLLEGWVPEACRIRTRKARARPRFESAKPLYRGGASGPSRRWHRGRKPHRRIVHRAAARLPSPSVPSRVRRPRRAMIARRRARGPMRPERLAKTRPS